MKTLQFMSMILGLLILSAPTNGQSIISTETFPNTFNTSGTNGNDGNFNGNLGSWNVITSSVFSVEVDGNENVSAPNALRINTNTATASTTAADNRISSPIVGLNFGACTPSGVTFSFELLPVDVENGSNDFTLGLEFFNGTTWATVLTLTSNQIFDNYGEGNADADWETVSVNLANSYWNPAFRYRFYVVKNTTSGQTNTTDIWIDDITLTAITTGPAFPDFSDATPTKITDGGAPGGGYEVGDVFRFDNVITVPNMIHAEIKIEAIVNAVVTNLDNNAAGISQRFQPRIRPDVTNLTSDREGYVQFSITFRNANTNNIVFLDGLRYRHFDVDGSIDNNGNDAYTFRETGWISGHNALLVNMPSDLTNGGVFNSGPPAGTSWTKVLGEMAEHDGITSDPDIFFTATYGASSVIRFRLGYIFDETGSNANFSPGAEGREYASEFGCFDLTEQATLPVKLLSFSGAFRNNATTLNWETVNEDNFDHFEIERSKDGISFDYVGSRESIAGSFSARKQYNYFDDLSVYTGAVAYYRLKMVDSDGKFKYSNIILIRKDSRSINGVTISPNPIINGVATVRFTANTGSNAEIRIVDMAGRTVLVQNAKIYEGTNSITVDNLSRLQPGIYMLQMKNREEVSVVKFSITR